MSTPRYSHVTRALAETPWAILPDTFAAILEAVSVRAHGGHLTEQEIEARIGSGPARRVGYQSGTVAVLPLYGTIFPRANLVSEMSGGTSLQQWAAAFDDAVRDPRVSSILIDVHSPGGSTFLLQETAARIRAARKEKPVVAIANALCASAAIHLASQASELVATPSALVGSIGVFMAHEDWSRAEEMEGIKTTLIHAGEYKVEGNQHEPLGDEARAALQSIVDDLYAGFVKDVAAGRGVTVATVERNYGQGRILTASQALKAGMVDRVESFEQTLDRLRSTQTATAGRAGGSALWSRLGPGASGDAPEPDDDPDDHAPVDEPDDQDDDVVDGPDLDEADLTSLQAVRSDMRGEALARSTARELRELEHEMRNGGNR